MGLFNKLDELQAIITTMHPDVIGITESHFTASFPSSTYNLPGYDIHRADRITGTHGGAVIYTKTSLSAVLSGVHVDPSGEWESVWCSLTLAYGKTLDIGCYYRIPSKPIPEHWPSLLNSLTQCPATALNSSALIMGDFNFPSIDWNTFSTSQSNFSASHAFLHFIQENALNQYVTRPTRHRQDQRSSLLDLILTTNNITASGVTHLPPLGRSDHDLITFSLDIAFSSKTTKTKRYNFKNTDYILINDIISSIDWNYELAGLDVDTQLNLLNSFLTNVIETFIPTVEVSLVSRSPWISQEVRSLVNKKKRAYRNLQSHPSPSNLSIYKDSRNKAVTGIRKAKHDFERDLVLRAKTQPKILYAYLNADKKTQPANSLKNSDGSITTDDLEIACKLNSHFSHLFTPIPNHPIPSPCYGTVNFSQSDVEEALLGIKETTSSGPDGLPALFLKRCAKSLALPTYIIFHNSVHSCTFPTQWKDANITPIHKSGSPHNVNNYRPISLLSILSKILERFISKDVISQCHELGVLHETQHGFLPGRSCVTNLLCTYDQISSIVDAGIPCDIIFLDFSKAFDSIRHSTLIDKLKSFGFSNSCIAWIQSYLFDRRQRVQLRGNFSPWTTVSAGVPQGSVLGPLLFNIYMSDLPRILSVLNISYADDFKLFGPAVDCSLQINLNQVFVWANCNSLILNPEKCAVLHLGHNNPKTLYYLGGNALQICTSHRDLGVIVDDKLKFDQHVDSVVNKATRKAHYILKKFIHLDTHLFALLYKTFIRPILEYSSQICRPYHSTQFSKLESCQRRLTKWCKSIRHLTYEERLQTLKLQSVRHRFDRGDAILTYQILTGLLDVRPFFFTPHVTLTRGHSLKLQGSTSRLHNRHYFFTERVIKPWNNLSEFVISAPTLNSFKSRYDAWIT